MFQLFHFFSAIVLLSLCVACTPDDKVAKQPNIVFIFTDDHATKAITAYDDFYGDYASTPNIDRIADEGIIFNNVYCTNAICGPSRASILTGQYNHKNGYLKNNKGGYFNNKQWTFPKALQENGYQTALVGKWHLASEPKGFDYYKYHVAHGEQGVYWNPVYSENGDTIKVDGYATNLTSDFALDWLNNVDKKNPFCLMLQYKAPHRPWQADSVYLDLWENETLPYPESFNDNYAGRELTAGNTHMTMDYFNRRDMKLTPPDSLSGKQLRNWFEYGNKPHQNVIIDENMSADSLRKWKYQRYMKDYLKTIKSVDDNIGRMLAYLKENNLEENTIVVYSSDQGFFLGDHGWFDKRFMYEEALKMPFIIRYPEKLQAGGICNDIITNIDFAPTLLEMAQIDIPKSVQGKSFFSNITTGNADWRQSMYYHYYEFPQWHHVQPHYGIRTVQYKLIHFYYNVDVWELYDLNKDPNELNNLIHSVEHQPIVDSLKVELNVLMKEYDNDKSLDAFRVITDTDYGGHESSKK